MSAWWTFTSELQRSGSYWTITSETCDLTHLQSCPSQNKFASGWRSSITLSAKAKRYFSFLIIFNLHSICLRCHVFLKSATWAQVLHFQFSGAFLNKAPWTPKILDVKVKHLHTEVHASSYIWSITEIALKYLKSTAHQGWYRMFKIFRILIKNTGISELPEKLNQRKNVKPQNITTNKFLKICIYLENHSTTLATFPTGMQRTS